jgi:hypothetical protein
VRHETWRRCEDALFERTACLCRENVKIAYEAVKKVLRQAACARSLVMAVSLRSHDQVCDLVGRLLLSVVGRLNGGREGASAKAFPPVAHAALPPRSAGGSESCQRVGGVEGSRVSLPGPCLDQVRRVRCAGRSITGLTRCVAAAVTRSRTPGVDVHTSITEQNEYMVTAVIHDPDIADNTYTVRMPCRVTGHAGGLV